jgi:putative transposase
MTSPTALQYGIRYHIFSRGNNRENIFIDERDYHHFMELFLQHVFPYSETYAYCLLRNHFHIFIRIKKKAEIVEEASDETQKDFTPLILPGQRISNFLNAYAKSINFAYHRTGSLFQHPFRRIPVSNQDQFFNLVRYIHQNPQHHGFVKDFRDWPFSSHHILQSGNNVNSSIAIPITSIEPVGRGSESRIKNADLKMLGILVAGDFI